MELTRIPSLAFVSRDLTGGFLAPRWGQCTAKGTYFHKEAKYSSCYTDSRTLIMARVLVGDFVQGVSKYVRPPGKDPRDPHGDLYDSCVDNPAAPKIFVIFSQEQCYPEYLIKY